MKLLEKFAQEAHTDDCQKRRLTMLQSLGFGNTAPYEGNPVENIRQIRTAIKIKPFYRFNVPVKSYFSLVENHLDIVAKAHPLLLNFGKLTKILGAIVDEDPEREDIFADLRPSEQPGGKIRPSLPGWVLTAISSILGGFGKGLFDQLWPLLGPLVGAR